MKHFKQIIFFLIIFQYFSPEIIASNSTLEEDIMPMAILEYDNVIGDCDVLNLSISVSGGKAPYTIYWNNADEIDEIPSDDINLSVSYSLDISAFQAPTTINIQDFVYIVDRNGDEIWKSIFFDKDNTECGEGNISFNYLKVINPNHPQTPVGEGCDILTEFDIDYIPTDYDGVSSFFVYLEYTLLDFRGTEVMKQFKILSNAGLNDPTSGEITFVNEPIQYRKFTENMTLRARIWTDEDEFTFHEHLPISLNKYTKGIEKKISCTPIKEAPGPFCIGGSITPGFGLTTTEGRSSDWNVGASINLNSIPINVIKWFLRALSISIPVDIDFSYGQSTFKEISEEWSGSWTSCPECKVRENGFCEELNPEEDANFFFPVITLNEYKRTDKLEFVNCDGEWETKEFPLLYEQLISDSKCVYKPDDDCDPTPCEGPGFNFEIVDEQFTESEERKIVLTQKDGLSNSDFTYNWEGPEGALENSGSELSNLTGGEYCVTITHPDIPCCTQEYCIQIPCFTVESVVNDVTFNQDNGSILLNIDDPSSNDPQLSYWWTYNGLFYSVDQNISELSPGQYCVTVTDDDECTQELCETINSCNISINSNVTHASQNENDGSISISISGFGLGTGTTSYSYLWTRNNATYSTQQSISNLSPGEYCLKVTDNNNCEFTKCFEIIGCPEIEIDAPSVVNPTSCDESDGKILFLTQSHKGGIAPYSYLWSTGSTSHRIGELSIGEYLLTLTDSKGCTATETYILESVGGPELNIFNDILACEGMNNGMADVAVMNPLGHIVSYQWNNGATTPAIFNLSSGLYSVTVTFDDTGCFSVEQIFVDERESKGPLTIKEIELVLPCKNLSNGSISLSMEGGNNPYKYSWNNGSNSSINKDIPAGGYNVTVTDDCGRTISKSITLESLPQMELTFDSPPRCEEKGVINLIVNGGIEPYSYEWRNKDQNTPYFSSTKKNINELPSGSYCVTVTDGNKCTQNKCYNLKLANATIISQDDPCEGSTNGTIELEVSNPELNPDVVVILDDLIEFPVNISELETVTIGDFGTNENHKVTVKIGECNFVLPFYIKSKPKELTLTNFEDTDGGIICAFDSSCDGIDLGTYVEPAYYDWGGGQGDGFFTTCKVPVYCNGTFVEDKKIGVKTVRVLEYVAILNNALYSGYISQALFDSKIAELEEKQLLGCDRIRYCPGNFAITWTSFPQELFNGAVRGIEPPDEDGCIKVRCFFPIDGFKICPGDLDLPFSDIDPTALPNCLPRQYNMAVLIKNIDVLYAEYPGFNDSELRDLLIQYENDDRANCATVTFCQFGFKVLHTNITEIECGLLPNTMTFDVFPTGELEFNYTCVPQPIPFSQKSLVVCKVPCTNPGEIECYDPMVLTNEFKSSNANQKTIKLFVDKNKNEKLVNFGLIKNEGNIAPKGLIKDGKQSYFWDYSHLNNKVDKVESPELINYIDNWDEEKALYVQEDSHEENYSIHNIDQKNAWVQNLTSSNYLEIEHFSEANGKIIVGGIFENTLSLNEINVAQSTKRAPFIMMLNTRGEIEFIEVLSNILNSKSAVFSENQFGGLLIGGKTETSNSSNKQDKYSIYSFDTQSKLSLISEMNVKGQFEILDLVISKDYSQIAMATLSDNDIIINGSTISTHPSQLFNLFTYSLEGNKVILSESIDSRNLDFNNLDITYNDDSSLYFGFTFTNAFKLKSKKFESLGQKDIGIAKFDNLGKLVGSKTYGSQENESLSHLLYNNNVLFFGGEYEGMKASRILGNYHFIGVNKKESTAYITFINDDQFELNQTTSVAETQFNDNQVLKVYPNPFSQHITIEFQSNQNGNSVFTLYDISGKKVFANDNKLNKNLNVINLETPSSLPDGVYTLVIKLPDGNLLQERIIKNAMNE